MRYGWITALSMLMFSVSVLPNNASSQSVFPIRLNTLEGGEAVVTPSKSSPYSVIVFLLPDCPACQSYTRTLKQLYDKYSRSGIRFIGVFAGRYSKQEEMLSFRKEFGIPFALYVDTDHDLIRTMGIHVAPEVAVIDPSGRALYRGRIDDWMYAVGKKRTMIRNHDLEKALSNILAGKNPDPAETVPIGCIIE